MKKVLTIACLLVATAIFAQSPLNIAVWDDISIPAQSRDNDTRLNYLIWEYFKSELATHSGLSVVSDATLAKKMEKAGFERGKAITAAQISRLCKDVKANYFCTVGITRSGDKKLTAKVTIYESNGKEKAQVKREFESVRESDILSIVLANDTATAIRGKNPVDEMIMESMKKVVKDASTDEIKAEIDKNIKAVK